MNAINKRGFARRFEGWCRTCELVMLRALLFGCFTFEVYRFVHWLCICSPR